MTKPVRAMLALVAGLIFTSAVRAQEPTPVVPVTRITSPIPRQDARGSVAIQGAAQSPAFARYEIAFASDSADPTDPQSAVALGTAVWTVIGGSNQPVPGGTLLTWNTRPLTDGTYALRLQVFNTDGTLSGQTLVRSVKLINQAVAQAAANSAAQAQTAPGAVEAEPESTFDTARSVLDQLTVAVGRIPTAFERGARIALIGLGAVIAYATLKKLLFWLWARFFRKPVDYGR
jgi:hypothetical protein